MFKIILKSSHYERPGSKLTRTQHLHQKHTGQHTKSLSIVKNHIDLQYFSMKYSRSSLRKSILGTIFGVFPPWAIDYRELYRDNLITLFKTKFLNISGNLFH